MKSGEAECFNKDGDGLVAGVLELDGFVPHRKQATALHRS
jgi:hypothetical protein